MVGRKVNWGRSSRVPAAAGVGCRFEEVVEDQVEVVISRGKRELTAGLLENCSGEYGDGLGL